MLFISVSLWADDLFSNLFFLSELSPATYATILICDFQFSSGCLFETHSLFRFFFLEWRWEKSRSMNYMGFDMVELYVD